ncbi:MAG: hypothetical protein PHV25_02395 [Candidatus Pacebacteria bacterium]|nr:hypothetical protein [Candidatus Paceibacterota bacterium]
MNKFIKEQEKQEILVYIGVFLVIFFLLFNFVGISFDFTVMPHYLESKKNFGEIKAKLEKASELYNINELRTFELIPDFDGITGKDDPFSREVAPREDSTIEEGPEEDSVIAEDPIIEELEAEESFDDMDLPELPEDTTIN